MLENGSQLTVVGVNFRNTALTVRGKFAFTPGQIQKIYGESKITYPDNFFILSTCNRTEIYSTAWQPELLLNVLREHSGLSKEQFGFYPFVKSGNEAVKHLYRVAAGLDSQILGDHEIIGQLKKAFSLAKSFNKTTGYMEKLVNSALQASKEIKTQTALSNGTTSVSYAIIQILRQVTPDDKPLRICITGLGKIGMLTLKNLKYYLPNHRITLVNRNADKAKQAAGELQVAHSPLENLEEVLKSMDVLVVATAADKAIVSKGHIAASGVKLIFDLSVPSNVDVEVRQIPQVKLFNIDELSAIVNQIVETRKSEVPLAEAIIEKHIHELKEWEVRRNLYSTKVVNQPDNIHDNFLGKVA